MAELKRLRPVEEEKHRPDFVDFFRAEYPGLIRALYVLTGNRHEAEDLAQDAMARVLERWERVRVMAAPEAYVYRVAVNLNRKRLRWLAVRAKRAFAVASPTASSPDPDARTELSAALASLPKAQRETLMLVEWLGLSSEEAAKFLGIQPSSVRSRIHRARTSLAEHFGEGGPHA